MITVSIFQACIRKVGALILFQAINSKQLLTVWA